MWINPVIWQNLSRWSDHTSQRWEVVMNFKTCLLKVLLSITLLPMLAMAQSPLDTVNAASKDVCSCLEWPYQAMRESMVEVREAQINGDFSQIQNVQNQLLSIIQSAESCVASLTTKYPSIDQSTVLQEKLLEKVESICPSPI